MIIERIQTVVGLPYSAAMVADHVRVLDVEGSNEASQHALAAAREAEHYGQLALLTQTIRVTLDVWPECDRLPLPIAPVLLANTVTMTVDAVAFTAFAVSTGLRPSIGLTAARPCGLIIIQYTAGFGDQASSIPADLAHAILDQAAAFYDERGNIMGKSNGMSTHMSRIVARYRRVAL